MLWRSLAVAVVVLSAPALTKAAAPNGSYTISTGQAIPLVRGSSETCAAHAHRTACVSLTVDTTLDGAIDGSGVLALEGDLELEQPIELSGQLKAHGSKLRASLAVSGAGDDYTETGRLLCKAKHALSDVLACAGAIQLCPVPRARGSRCRRIRVRGELPVESQSVGVQLEVTTDALKGRITGTGELDLDGEPALQCDVRGQFSEDNDRSTLTLCPDSDPPPARLSSAVFDGANVSSGTLQVELFGQREQVLLPPAPAPLVDPNDPWGY